MRTYPIHDELGRLRGFEVSSLLGRRMARRVAAKIPGSRIVSTRLRQDLFCEFEVGGIRYGIEEPWGDNSRYCIRPIEGMAAEVVSEVREHFERSRTGSWAIRASVLLIGCIAVAALGPPIHRFLSQDRCLDAGGRWDASAAVCTGR